MIIYLEHFTTFDSRHNYENTDGNDCSLTGIDQFVLLIHQTMNQL